MLFSKKIIFVLFSGIAGLFMFLPAPFAHAGPIGTSVACAGAATRGADFCYDNTNVETDFLAKKDASTFDTYSDSVGLLSIVMPHNYAAKKIEFHLCQVVMYSSINGAQITSDGNGGKILINTKDGVYNGKIACASKDNYLKISGPIRASGHDGWIEINTYNFEMQILGYAGVGSLITSGTFGYNRLKSINNSIEGGAGGKGGIRGGMGGYGGGSGANDWCYGGAGFGGTIKINTVVSVNIDGVIFANGGDDPYDNGGGGGGGIIEISSLDSIYSNNVISANGGDDPFGDGGGGGGTIKIDTRGILNVNNIISANGADYGAGGRIQFNNFLINFSKLASISAISQNGVSDANSSIIQITTKALSTIYGNISSARIIKLNGYSFDITSSLSAGSIVDIFSSATSTLSTAGIISGANTVKLQGFAFDINGSLTASAASGKIDVSATSSLNILGATNSISTGGGGNITLNSTSTAVTISKPINAPSGIVVVKSGTDFNGSGATAVAITGAEISIFSGENLTIPTVLNLNATAGTGKIILQSCKKIKIQGNLNSSISDTVGSIIIFANDFEATTGGSIKSLKNLQIYYANTCSGLEASPGLCSPLNFATGLLIPLPPSITKVTGSTTCNLGKVNTPPYVPKPIEPLASAVGMEVCPTLKWNAGDLEGNDLTFQIYFSSASSSVINEEAIANIGGFTATSTSVGKDYTFSLKSPVCPLNFQTLYYWKVKAIDNP